MAVALVSLAVAVACSAGESAASDPTAPAAPVTTYRLDEASSVSSDEAPLCWVSFKDGERAGGCSTGSLDVEEIGTGNGLVEGWNGVVSHIEVPTGWTVHSYHQMWVLGPEENARRQGFLVHGPFGAPTQVRLGTGEHPIIRDSDGANWNYCREWHPEAIAGATEQETAVNDNLQCLYIDPDEVVDGDTLILSSEDPPASGAQLRITYVP